MKKLGQFLKSERKKQNLKLEEMHSRTKIHIHQLRDIEEGHRDRLPAAKVFCIGLIKSYARELRVDMDQLNALIEEAFADPGAPLDESTPPVKSSTSPDKDTSPQSDDDSQLIGWFRVPKPMIVAGSIILSLVLIVVILEVIEKMNAYSKEEALPREVLLSDEEVSSVETVTEKQDDVGKSDTVTEKSDKPNIPSTPSPKIKTPEAEAISTPAPADALSSPTQVSAKEDFTDDNFSAQPTPPPKKTADVVSDNKLSLTALEPVRAEIIWSDGFVQVMLLKSNETKTLVFSQPITLRVNNGGAVQVSFNEAEKKVPGPFNKPIEIQYP
jgi:cytoskeletal protein RodZ